MADRLCVEAKFREKENRGGRQKKSYSFADCHLLSQKQDGHQGGDRCLKKVADGLYSAIHRERDLLARYGGEEFCVVLPDTDLAGAVKVAEEMHQAIKALRIAHVNSTVGDIVSISIGVSALVPQSDTEPEILVAAADQALYKAKEDGRDRVQSELVRSESN